MIYKFGMTMKRKIWVFFLAFGTILSVMLQTSNAQLQAPGSGYTDRTSYPVFTENDPIFIFCTTENTKAATLRAITTLTGSKTWLWEKFNPQTGAFDFFQTVNNSANQHQLTSLEDGCYRVKITKADTVRQYRAWVFNNWNSAAASIPESNCEFFILQGTVGMANLVYYDLASRQPVEITKKVDIEWKKGDDILSKLLSFKVYDPPTKDTDYTLRVSDKFGCENSIKLTYKSIVTKASFTADPMKGEAPLEVKFTNNSENGDPGSYEWFFFKDLDEIKLESEKTNIPIDSIMLVAYDDNPIYTYENSGSYMVKLVSKHKSELHTCTDTFYLPKYIVADTSFIQVPNVFSPNGDGTNDNFVVKFWSMKEVKISIFNRWGRVVHVWSSGNVRGFKDTWLESVWDGKIGGRYASPGVYFYVVEGYGRDDTKRWKHGNVYLFRDKN
jgi:gliding motility-associated-like protein